MLDGIDHNPSVSAPYCQVARLRIYYAPKFVDACVEVRRGSVRIRETGALVESMDEVGAIGLEGRMVAGIQCGTNDRQTFIESQRSWLAPQARVFGSDSVSLMRASLFLLGRHSRNGHGTERNQRQDDFGVEPHPLY